jgi:hypothetical protein
VWKWAVAREIKPKCGVARKMAQYVTNAELKKLGARPAKYGNKKKLCVAGHQHDSKREAARCDDLGLLQLGGEISELRFQPRYDLVVDGMKVCSYVADFEYHEKGQRIVEDVKGAKTRIYQLKKKLMRACLGIEIRET